VAAAVVGVAAAAAAAEEVAAALMATLMVALMAALMVHHHGVTMVAAEEEVAALMAALVVAEGCLVASTISEVAVVHQNVRVPTLHLSMVTARVTGPRHRPRRAAAAWPPHQSTGRRR
jgi:hypothetical protein